MKDDMQPRSIAPWPHTLGIIALLVAWAVLGGHRAQAAQESPRSLTYVSSLMMSWMLFGSVVAGVYFRRQFFFNTLEREAKPWRVEVIRGFGIYLASLALFLVVASILYHTRLRSGFDHTVVEAIAPRNIFELVGWLALSVTAGFCEEHVFRGYLLPQVMGWLREAGMSSVLAACIAVVTTSVLFGSLHLYEGLGGAVIITFLGAFYALLALQLRNLRVVIVAHSMLDFFIVLLLFLRHLHGR